jgi:GT2 family glycosyltransferase
MEGMDESFLPAWWEDVDFCRRLHSRLKNPGFPAASGFVVEPRAKVLHHGGSSVDDLGREAFLSAFNSNLLRYAELHHQRSIGMIRLGLRLSNGLRSIARSVKS